MKLRKLLFPLMVLLTLTSIGSFKEKEMKVEVAKQELITNVKRMAQLSEDYETTDEEIEMFSLALESVKDELSKYLDITGLNVTEKESITLPEYDENYVVPEDSEVISSSYEDMIESFDEESLEVFEERRQNNLDFDSFATKAENRFKNLNIRPKYFHKLIQEAYNPNSVQNRMNDLLKSAGLTATAIAVLITCADTLVATAPIAWFVPVSVPVSTAALLGIAAVIILNWEVMCKIINELIDLFVECIKKLAYLVRAFFNWVLTQVQTSSVSGTIIIGGQSFTFTEIRTDDVTSTISFLQQCRRNKDVLLMQYVKTESFQIALGTPVTADFCISNKTHLNGYSSYTWYQNEARNLILKAGTGYTSANPELHLYNENEEGNNSPRFAFKHFHNYTNAGIRDNSNTTKRSHSFFGLLYYTPNNDGEGVVHPSSPQN